MSERTAEEQKKFEIAYNSDEGYWENPDEEDFDDDPCSHCGPWCDDWAGDGLCMMVINEQARQAAHYKRHHIGERCCPVCKIKLKRYDCVGVNELWSWNPGEYDPMVAIDVLGPLWLNKGEIHHQGNLYHIWIEWGTGKRECLIRLLSEGKGMPRQ